MSDMFAVGLWLIDTRHAALCFRTGSCGEEMLRFKKQMPLFPCVPSCMDVCLSFLSLMPFLQFRVLNITFYMCCLCTKSSYGSDRNCLMSKFTEPCVKYPLNILPPYNQKC
ncbi:hypothetical protein AMECASPLE_033095 [Ameca splendens]|uniref:Secreted protein n=1 Tax=Ameca splendens TaxID=208324 RepID=A0ABV1AEM0_9TELE